MAEPEAHPAPTGETPAASDATPQPPQTGPADGAPEVPTPAAAPLDASAAPPETSETPAATPETPTFEPQVAPTPRAPTDGVFLGTGRRKASVARVRLIASKEAKILINKRDVDNYFSEPHDRSDVQAPLQKTGTGGDFRVLINVHGGGHTGQAGAIRLGIARALIRANEKFELALREEGFLTRDARRVERKKYGQKKARKRFQFSKR